MLATPIHNPVPRVVIAAEGVMKAARKAKAIKPHRPDI
jgi:hypothetical protein